VAAATRGWAQQARGWARWARRWVFLFLLLFSD